jgi:hypothetical protein
MLPSPRDARAGAFSPGCLSTPSTSSELSAGATGELQRYSTASLAAATDNFSPARLLGEGGFGEVFAARWPDGTVLAVKRMAPDSTEGEAGFLAEVSVTGAVRHANVLPVLGVVRARACVRATLPCGRGGNAAYNVERASRGRAAALPRAPRHAPRGAALRRSARRAARPAAARGCTHVRRMRAAVLSPSP